MVDTHDPVFFIATDMSGRRVATYRGTDEHPKETFIHDDDRPPTQAPIRGPIHRGGPILRDRDAVLATNPEEWAAKAANESRFERHYYLLDWRGVRSPKAVSAIVTSDGEAC